MSRQRLHARVCEPEDEVRPSQGYALRPHFDEAVAQEHVKVAAYGGGREVQRLRDVIDGGTIGGSKEFDDARTGALHGERVAAFQLSVFGSQFSVFGSASSGHSTRPGGQPLSSGEAASMDTGPRLPWVTTQTDD